MNIEYEVKFISIDIDTLRVKLQEVGAKMEYAMRDMRRKIFDTNPIKKGAYVRVRDEGDKVTMTYKNVQEEHDELGVQEVEVIVSDFESSCSLLRLAGLQLKSYQETKREKWTLGSLEIVIDIRPGLNPYVEIEGSSIDEIKKLSHQLGFDYDKDGVFGTLAAVVEIELGKSRDELNSLSVISFENPIK